MTTLTPADKLRMFRAGQYKFQPPPEPHGKWDNIDWVHYIDRCGVWTPQGAPAHRLILEIARDIKAQWPKPYFGAVPYLEAMLTMTTVDKKYGEDNAESIVVYFLANANTFRGEHARRLKQELKDIAGIK
jgi:hypothetical protein